MIKIDDIIGRFEGFTPVGESWSHHFAVMLLLVTLDEEKGPEIVYEVRAKKLDRQPGEVCFPGGQIEEDETPLDAALRETEEELGICKSNIDVISKLGIIGTRAGAQIHCFIGVIGRDDFEDMDISTIEVDQVFTVPVEDLMNTECEVYWNDLKEVPAADFPYDRVTSGEAYKWRDGKAPVPVFDVNGWIIWGLTGRMTKEFLEVLRRNNNE